VKRPCIIFDCDGNVNELPETGFVARRDGFHLHPGFVTALRVALSKGLPPDLRVRG